MQSHTLVTAFDLAANLSCPIGFLLKEHMEPSVIAAVGSAACLTHNIINLAG